MGQPLNHTLQAPRSKDTTSTFKMPVNIGGDNRKTRAIIAMNQFFLKNQCTIEDRYQINDADSITEIQRWEEVLRG